MIDDFVDCGQQRQGEKREEANQQQLGAERKNEEIETQGGKDRQKVTTSESAKTRDGKRVEKDNAFLQVLRNQEQLIEDLVYRELVNIVDGDEQYDFQETSFGIYVQELFRIFYFEQIEANSNEERSAECRRQRATFLDLIDECRSVKNAALHLFLSQELQRNLEEERRCLGIE